MSYISYDISYPIIYHIISYIIYLIIHHITYHTPYNISYYIIHHISYIIISYIIYHISSWNKLDLNTRSLWMFYKFLSHRHTIYFTMSWGTRKQSASSEHCLLDFLHNEISLCVSVCPTTSILTSLHRKLPVSSDRTEITHRAFV